MKRIIIISAIFFSSCQLDKNEIHNDFTDLEELEIKKDIMSWEEFDELKVSKRTMILSTFWSGMSKPEAIRSLNFLLEKGKIFIDTTCLIERIQDYEVYSEKYKKHLVNNNYIESSILDNNWFESSIETKLFTFWLDIKEDRYKVYCDFMFGTNPLTNNDELEQITLSVYNTDIRDFENFVNIYSEKYGSPVKKKILTKEQKLKKMSSMIYRLGEMFEISSESFLNNGILVKMDISAAENTPKACNIPENDTSITIYYRDRRYDDKVNEERKRLFKIQEEIDFKIQKESELRSKKKINEQI